MDERSFRLVKILMQGNIIKRSKFFYVFAISLISCLSPLTSKISIQNYSSKNNSSVDYFLEIKENNIEILFSLISRNMYYRYEQLINMTCIDILNLYTYKKNKNRFQIVYLLNSINTTSNLLISLLFPLDTILNSITSIFRGALWLEREIYDLFGVFFSKHRDLRRILTDYGFKGFPLRKDFPLTGYIELRFSEELKSVKYQPLKLIQEYRYFNFESPWNSVNDLIKKHEII